MSPNLYTHIFTKLDLSKEQARIYESLVANGAQTAGSLAKTASVTRTYVYALTDDLVKKGLLVQKQEKGKTTFHPLPPDALLDHAKNKKLAADQALKEMENILPTLRSQYSITEHKPIIRVFEGVDGMIAAHKEILAEKKDILAYVRIDAKLDEPLNHFWPWYFAKRVKENIRVRAICPDTPDGIAYKKLDEAQLRETRLIPFKDFPFQSEKNIVADKVAYFSKRENELIATIIENSLIADTERAVFELAWKGAMQY